MMNQKSSRLTVAVLVVAVALLVAGGAAVASNMGFKLNKPITLAGAGQVGSNWTSVPYNNPYGTVGQLCSQTGLTSTGTIRASGTVLNETTGAFTTVQCGTSAANALTLIPGKGLSLRQPNLTGAPTSIIIVGSHNPTLSLTIPDAGAGQVGSFWFAVPYHTTAVSANDLCLSIGLTSTGTIRASVTRLNAATGAFTTVQCGTSAAQNLALVLGEHISLREPNGPKSFSPAHF
jgi:hypothetical protein